MNQFPIFVIFSFSWFMKLTVIYLDSCFHVIPYLTCKWFKFIYYLLLNHYKLMNDHFYFSNNLKVIKDHKQDYTRGIVETICCPFLFHPLLNVSQHKCWQTSIQSVFGFAQKSRDCLCDIRLYQSKMLATEKLNGRKDFILRGCL